MSAFTDIFIKRPVLATCFNLLILIIGYQALSSLNIRQYPRSDSAVVTVSTAYIGANSDLVRGYITTPLERVIASINGIEYLESSSQQGLSTIRVQLKLNYDTDSALTQIQAKIAQVRNDLPPEAEAPTINIESSDDRIAGVYISFFSKDLESNQITDYLTRAVQPKLSSISGVQKADILGARTFAMRIWLKPEKLVAYNLSATDVQTALSANNYLSTLGQSKGPMVQVNLVANTDLKTVDQFKRLTVAERNGSLIRLQDIADVVLGAESYDEDVRFGGEAATFLGVWVLPTANSLDVIKEVRSVLPDIEAALPEGIEMKVPYDSTLYIRDAIYEVIKTLLETVLIVIIVIFLFIGSFRAVLVPIVTIPLSLIGAGILMLFMGFTINLLTLLGIVLAVGIVVDDAIVMLENIERHVRDGLSPIQAALVGARELAGPTIAMTITLLAVYAPIGLQGGLTGSLFKEFAFTLAGAVLISGIVALTLSPMMSSKLVRHETQPSKIQTFTQSLFDRLKTQYQKTLTAFLRHYQVLGILPVFAIILASAFYLFSQKELAPAEDQGVLFGFLEASPNSTVEQSSKFAEQAKDIFQSVPERFNTFQITGPSSGFSGVVLKPWSERSRTSQEIQAEIFGKVYQLPGIQLILVTPPPLPGGSDFPIEFIISTTNEPRELAEFANQLVGAAFASGLFIFAKSDLNFDLPQAKLLIDHDKVATLGLNLEHVGRELGILMGGDYVNRFSVQGRSYKVIPQIKRSARLTPEQLEDLYIPGRDKKMIPVSLFAKVVTSVEPRQLNKFQQLNSAKIQGVLRPGATVADGINFLEAQAKNILPAKGFEIDYAGESRQFKKEGNKLLAVLVLSAIVIFLVLAAQFESFRDPFIILLGSVPLALCAALFFVCYGFTTMNIYSQVGLITLIGLVSKNGILIVEFANKLQEKGLSKLEAVIEASSSRLRSILMTSVATVVGHFPLVIASGAGSAARNSIGTVLVTGMTVGTIFTLFVVPALYLVIASKREAKH